MKKQKILTQEDQFEDNQLDYLAEVLIDAFMQKKGYEEISWLNGEKQYLKKSN